MSMISGQVDRLRTAAQTYRRLGNHSAESMLLDAADTIWQLRDDLQRANDAVLDAKHDESRAWDRVRKAEGENAKLLELAVGMYGMLEMVDKMLGNHDACETPRPLIFGEDKSFKDVMRVLGVDE